MSSKETSRFLGMRQLSKQMRNISSSLPLSALEELAHKWGVLLVLPDRFQ